MLCTLALANGLLFAGCAEERGAEEHAASTLAVWAHSGRESERQTLEQHVARFNANNDLTVEITFLPDGAYNSQVQAAALANELPDVLEFDGPFVYNYVWQGHLIPLDGLVSKTVRKNVLSSIIEQGTYRGKLYSLGMYDSGLGLYGRRSMLEAAGARIPAGPEDAWTVAEFETILANLAAEDEDGQVLDLKLNYRGEWYCYAFSPPLQSAGADLINRDGYDAADGFLNSPEAVGVMQRFQTWIDEKNYVDPNVDDNAFVGGRVALSWVGHWEYRRYKEAAGDDLVLLPLPDFGKGTRTGQGSWNWGITQRCEHPEGAMRFIEFLLEDQQVLEMTNANAAVPGTKSAIAKSELYGAESPLRLFVTQLRKDYAVPRPRTPAYPVITSAFEQAFNDVKNGAEMKTALDKAVADIDQDIRDNQGYPPRTEQ